MRDTNELVTESILQVFSSFKSELIKRYKILSLTISPMHSRSMQVIKHKKNCTSQHVADLLNRDKAQIARLIGELVNQGFVDTQPSLIDKRNRLLMLTTSGENVMKEVKLTEESVTNKMVKGISTKELEQFVITATKMVNNISANQQKSAEKLSND